ncbi:hypothetical protein Z052_01815 [Halorubrum sp. C191]|uniref:hypothetical protein n=1 Tax=Halorubrum sp. C191 TaxID=1383842 RepID=UPI000C0736AA|nr:hypothetical protein [Halorubrum sp. C191]PHQ43899.1 hypothetical protein Z052_01815 [Halorubrum sp. C191]
MPTDVELSVIDASRSFVRLPIRYVERHLTPEEQFVTCQGIGHEFQIAVASDRDNIVLRMPTAEWYQTKPYEQRLHIEREGTPRTRVYVGRHIDRLAVERSNGEQTIPATLEVVEHGILPES